MAPTTRNLALFTLLLAAAPSVAAAQSAPDSVARSAGSMIDSVTVLPPVRVDEARPELERKGATSMRLERGKLTQFLPTSTADALLSASSVDLVKTGPWASRVSVRGLAGDRVLVMVDGVRLNSVRGHGAQPSLVSLDRLDAVDVMPGANSVLYGSDALGGVVNLVTHRSLFSDDGIAGFTLSARGSDPGGAWSQSVRVRLQSPSVGLELSGGLGGRSALVTPSGRVDNSGDREEDLAGRLALRGFGALLDYEHTHHAARDIGLPAFNGSGGAASGEYPLQGREADRLELSMPRAGLRPELRVLGVLQTLRTDFTESAIESTFFRGNFVGTRSTVAADRVTTRARSVQPALTFGGFGALRLIGEYRREDADGPRDTDVTVRNRDGVVTSATSTPGESVPAATRDVWGAGLYATETFAGVRVESGVRYDAIRSRADSTVHSSTSKLDVRDHRSSVEGGLSRPFGPLEPYLHAASGFRAPNLEERYFNNDIHGGLRLYGNPDLGAERSESYEAGLRVGELFGGRIASARVTAHRSNVDDLITFEYVALVNGVPRFQYANVHRARIEGMEYALEARAGAVRLGISAAFPRGFDLATGERLADIGTARAMFDVRVPVQRLLPQGSLAARVRWNDAVWSEDPLIHRDAFSTVSLEASAVFGGVRGVLAVHNLFDAEYREPSSFIAEPGRTFALALKRDFSTPWRAFTRSRS